MKVWVVFGYVDYEGSALLGIYENPIDAFKKIYNHTNINGHHLFDSYDYEEWETE